MISLTPQVDCNETPDDPLCETATIPEAGDGGSEDDAGEDPSNSDSSSPEDG